ncbi:MAG: hypothetical protein ACSNEK_01670 [Parachlamydiaceae bacterium]
MVSPISGKSPYLNRVTTSSLTPKRLNMGVESPEQTDETDSNDDVDTSSSSVEEEVEYSYFWGSVTGLFGAIGQTAKKTTENAFLYGANVMASRVRKDDESYLRDLLGDSQIEEALRTFIPELCQAVKCLTPDLFDGRNEQTIAELAENLSLHILANFSRKIFPPSQKEEISEEQEILKEKVPKERFFGELGYFILRLFWEHLYEIDQVVEEEGEIDEDLFDPLVKELLDIALPSETYLMSAGKAVVSIPKHLKAFLCSSYKKTFHGNHQEEADPKGSEKQFDTRRIKNFDKLMQYGKEGVFFFLNGFACHIIQEENAFFQKSIQSEELPWILKVLLQPLMNQIQTLVPNEYQASLPRDSEAIENLIVAFFLNILSSLGRRCDQKVQPSELFKQIFLQVYVAFQEGLQEANKQIELKKRKKPKYFNEIVDRVLETLAPEHHEFFGLIKRRFPRVFEMISSIIMDLFVAFEMKEIEEFEQRFRTLTWEPERILKSHATLNQVADVPTKELSETFGNEDLLINVLHFCEILSQKSVAEMTDLVNDRRLITEALTDEYPVLNQLSLTEEVLKGFGEALLSDKCKEIFDFAQKWISSLLFKGTVFFLANASPKKKIPTKYLLPTATKKLVVSLSQHFQTIQGNIANLDGDEQQSWHVLFVPLSKELIKIFMLDCQNLGQALPVPEWLQEPVVQLISNQILPRLLCKSYREIYTWNEERLENQEKLSHLFGSERMNEAIRILSLFVPNSIAYLLRSSYKDLATSFLEVIQDHIKEPRDQRRLFELLSFFFRYIGKGENDFSDLWGFLTNYCEGALLKVFADFFTKINQMETLYLVDPAKCHEGGFLIGLIFNVMEEATAHFNMINQIKNEEKIKHASRVRDSILIQGFNATSLLHEAMTPEKRVVFFKEKAQEILRFLELNPALPLPVPNLGKGVWWGVFVDTLFPKVCEAVFEKIKDPSTIASIVFRSLKNINDALDSIEDSRANDARIEIPDDHLQRVLAQLASDLIDALVQLQPSVFGNEFLKKYRNFRIKVGEAIAASIRGKIEGYTLIEIVDLLVESALPSLHQGNWVAKRHSPNLKRREVKDQFVTTVRRSVSGGVKKGVDFALPMNKKEEKAKRERDKEDLEITMHEVVNELSTLFDKQGKLTLQAGFLGVWNQLQDYLDQEIENNFGKFGLKVKQKLDLIFHTFFSFFIYPLIKIISFPFIKLTWLIVKCYFKNQAKLRSEDIWRKINENLFFKMFDAFLKLLDDRNPSNMLIKS